MAYSKLFFYFILMYQFCCQPQKEQPVQLNYKLGGFVKNKPNPFFYKQLANDSLIWIIDTTGVFNKYMRFN